MTATPWTARLRHPRVLALLGLILAAVALYSVHVPVQSVVYGTPAGASMLLGLALCGAPLLALRWPRLAIAVFCAAVYAQPIAVSSSVESWWPWPWSVTMMIALVIVVSVLTVLHGWRYGLAAWALSIVPSLGAPLIRDEVATYDQARPDLIVAAAVSGGLFLIAVLVAGRIRLGGELVRERALTTAEQERRLLVEERARIARDLHDVVAHSMSLIQVQASTARYRVPGLSAEATGEFEDIAATARTSLTEMRRLLGVLRTEDQGPELAPQQGLADVAGLVESTRRAGVEVGLVLEVSEGVPAGVQVAGFRIAQEALSNAVRHAPGASVQVTVHPQGRFMIVEVHDDGAAAPGAPRSPGIGHGLRGMRERAALVDGTLEAGPAPTGGWTVSAALPWRDPDEEHR